MTSGKGVERGNRSAHRPLRAAGPGGSWVVEATTQGDKGLLENRKQTGRGRITVWSTRMLTYDVQTSSGYRKRRPVLFKQTLPSFLCTKKWRKKEKAWTTERDLGSPEANGDWYTG